MRADPAKTAVLGMHVYEEEVVRASAKNVVSENGSRSPKDVFVVNLSVGGVLFMPVDASEEGTDDLPEENDDKNEEYKLKCGGETAKTFN
ncbi:hypothetical protein HK098_005026 [Nowakowskiella sp. JEL0407]|nr:hypothetical protein HK098_005026 [Nowakowskiella sp. JEL0407]